MIRRPASLAIVPSLALMLSSMALQAEDAPVVAEQLGEQITVTAAKTASTLGQTPASTSVISADDLQSRDDRVVDDLADNLPAVHAINLGTHTSYPVIRGISSLSDQSPALVVIDGGTPRGLGIDSLLDAQQIEVLRGPQGALYGRSTIPGVIAITTTKPGRSWEGWGRLDGGSFNTLSAAAASGGPLARFGDDNDQIGLRLAARGERSDGWRTNTITDDDQAAARRDGQLQGSLAVKRIAGWEVRLSGLGARYRTTGDQFAPENLAADHRTANSEEGEFSNRVLASSLQAERDFGAGTLTSVTGASATRDVFDLDIDFSPVPGSTVRKVSDLRTRSQELRWRQGSGLRSWLVGLFVARDDKQVEFNQTVATAFLPPGTPIPAVTTTDGLQTTTNAALFGQAGIRLAPGWTLTLGLRLDASRLTVDLDSTASLAPAYAFSDDRTEIEVLPTAILSYAWDDGVLTWLSAARGFQGGGWNLTPNSRTEIDGGYEPETAITYEFGQRVLVADDRVRFEAAGFFTDYRDKQVTVLAAPSFLIRNAGRARITGVEGSTAVTIVQGWDVRIAASALRAVFTDYNLSPTVDLASNRLPMAPSYDGSASLGWRGESGLVARAEVVTIGSFYADDQNAVNQDSYRLLGARIGYEAEHWGVTLWGRNLHDAVYWTRAGVGATGTPVVVSGEPRSVGATLDARF